MPVYFARIGGRHGPIKIGHSFNPRQRIKALAIKYRKDVAIIALLDGDAIEFALHDRFKAHHVGPQNDLELFRPVRELLDFIRPLRLSKAVRCPYRSRQQVYASRGPRVLTTAKIKRAGVLLNDKGLSGPEVAKRLKVSTPSIYGHWRKNPNKRGPRFIPRKPKK